MYYKSYHLTRTRELVELGDASSLPKALAHVHKAGNDHPAFLIYEYERKGTSPLSYNLGSTDGPEAGVITVSGMAHIPVDVLKDPQFWTKHGGLIGEESTNNFSGSWPTLERLAAHNLGATTSREGSFYGIFYKDKEGNGYSPAEAFENLIKAFSQEVPDDDNLRFSRKKPNLPGSYRWMLPEAEKKGYYTLDVQLHFVEDILTIEGPEGDDLGPVESTTNDTLWAALSNA